MNNNLNLYNIVDLFDSIKLPYHQLIRNNLIVSNIFANYFMQKKLANYFDATKEILDRINKQYKKPSFDIDEVIINERSIKIDEVIIYKKPFCDLIHFKKKSKLKLPKLLILAPMAGHHATLLRQTVKGVLPYFDIFITDWIDPKNVPLSSGSFDMDDYIDYIIEFLSVTGPSTHLMAVCQPTVPALAAASIMSVDNNPNLPKSMILMGGPIDTRQSPTLVDIFAKTKDIEWFRDNVISTIPIGYPGFGRKVYPGFLQLFGFIMMNPSRHVGSHIDLFNNIADDRHDLAEKQKSFYDEYFAVMNLPAEFYLQTVEKIFQNHELATGNLVSRGRKIDLGKIKKSAIFAIEGENDDIAGIGQTKAALSLCVNIPDDKKLYYMQKSVGHYGIFSGSKFKEFIVPKIADFTKNL